MRYLRFFRHILWCILSLLLSGYVSLVQAQTEKVEVCFDYSCAQMQPVVFSPDIMESIFLTMQLAESAQEERLILAYVIGQMYRVAGEQTPIFRDRGGNYDDDRTLPGAMDCIDHSTTANAFLGLLQKYRLLRFHDLKALVSRGAWLSIHWAAQIQDRETGALYTVDRWFLDHGHPALVMPIEDWQQSREIDWQQAMGLIPPVKK